MSAQRMLPSIVYETTDFESSRIKELKSERLRIQQKTFTKWINSFLQKIGIQVETRGQLIKIISQFKNKREVLSVASMKYQ